MGLTRLKHPYFYRPARLTANYTQDSRRCDNHNFFGRE